MSLSRLVGRSQGPALSLLGAAATLWLGATGQLGLYIHPRYFLFTIILAAAAAVLAAAGFAGTPGADGHTHPDVEAPNGAGRWVRTRTAGSLLLIATAVLGLLIIPPATLTTATANQRGVNGTAPALTPNDTSVLIDGDYSSFTVKDWASLLRQGAGQDFFAGKTATLTGFITPDKTDPADTFLITRFVVTCCVVDAQPVGVPVYHPGWQSQHKAGSWVTLTGGFHPSPVNSNTIVLIPGAITPTDQPAQPYVY